MVLNLIPGDVEWNTDSHSIKGVQFIVFSRKIHQKYLGPGTHLKLITLMYIVWGNVVAVITFHLHECVPYCMDSQFELGVCYM